VGAGADDGGAPAATAYADLVAAWARAEVLVAAVRMESAVDAGAGTT